MTKLGWELAGGKYLPVVEARFPVELVACCIRCSPRSACKDTGLRSISELSAKRMPGTASSATPLSLLAEGTGGFASLPHDRFAITVT